MKPPHINVINSYFRIVFAFIMREMATSYGKSSLGYLWALIEPIGAILMLSLAFSVAFKTPALGDNFPLFYASGYIPFMMYNVIQGKISSAIRENRKLLFYPRVSYFDAISARFILHFLTQSFVAMIVFTGILWIFQSQDHLDVLPILLALVISSLLGLGIGSLNCVIIFLWPSWQQLWGIITRPLFVASCIFYMYDTLPDFAQSILWFNPLVHLVGMTRVGFYHMYEGAYITLVYPISVSIVTFTISLIMLRVYARDLINS